MQVSLLFHDRHLKRRNCRRFEGSLLSALAAPLCVEQPCAAKRPVTTQVMSVAITGLFAAQGCSYNDQAGALCLVKADVKVAIHCFNQPYAACEYQRHDSRPAYRPTVVPPFAAEGQEPCWGKSAGPHHPRLLGFVALPSRAPTGHFAHAIVTPPGHRLAV
jgi:hypothetical protein